MFLFVLNKTKHNTTLHSTCFSGDFPASPAGNRNPSTLCEGVGQMWKKKIQGMLRWFLCQIIPCKVHIIYLYTCIIHIMKRIYKSYIPIELQPLKSFESDSAWNFSLVFVKWVLAMFRGVNPAVITSQVLGSAVNPVLREGNSDRRVARPVKAWRFLWEVRKLVLGCFLEDHPLALGGSSRIWKVYTRYKAHSIWIIKYAYI